MTEYLIVAAKDLRPGDVATIDGQQSAIHAVLTKGDTADMASAPWTGHKNVTAGLQAMDENMALLFRDDPATGKVIGTMCPATIDVAVERTA